MADSSDSRSWMLAVQRIVAEALSLQGDERREFLEHECDDRALRQEVESQIEAAERTRSEPMADRRQQLGLPSLGPGDRVGPYSVLRFLGTGGFGEVYQAERHEPVHLRVALKVIKPDRNSWRVLSCFNAERQALALMNHPGVARIYDAGSANDGTAYFAMEFIDGLPITEHCDKFKLTIPERLELFVKVCEAVQHAHQKGVVHRDLKPGNILVTSDNEGAVPKVIDFGLAQALVRPLTRDAVDLRTAGTRDYMPPEQADPTLQDVDVRADVYALGVLLYKLLTGTVPFDLDQAAYERIVEVIVGEEPVRPSVRLSSETRTASEHSIETARQRGSSPRTLTRRIRGDLDWITLKCLEKDRTRRYSTVDALAKEIRRHLRDEPLDETGPPRPLDRVRKFVRRRRAEVITGGIVAAVLLAGVVWTTGLWVKKNELARRNAPLLVEQAKELAFESPKRAMAKLDEAMQADPELVAAGVERAFILRLQGRDDAAREEARRVLATHPDSAEAAGFLLGLAEDPTSEEAARYRRMAETLERRDRFHFAQALGTDDHEAAVALLTRSLDENPWAYDVLWQRAVRHDKLGDVEGLAADAELLTRVRPDSPYARGLSGKAAWLKGDLDRAAEEFGREIALAPDSWIGYYNRAHVLHNDKKYDAALLDIERALEITPDDARPWRLKGRSFIKLERWDAAVQALEHAVALGDDGLPGDLREALSQRAVTRLNGEDLNGARTDLERARTLEPEHPGVLFNLGRVCLLERRFDEALEHFDAVIRLLPDQPLFRVGRGLTYRFLGRTADALEDLDLASEAPRGEWIRLWLWELHASNGDRGAADTILSRANSAASDPLLPTVVRALRGELDADQLLSAAHGEEDRIYALYFLGLRERLRGNDAKAQDWFRQCARISHDQLERDLCRLGLVTG